MDLLLISALLWPVGAEEESWLSVRLQRLRGRAHDVRAAGGGQRGRPGGGRAHGLRREVIIQTVLPGWCRKQNTKLLAEHLYNDKFFCLIFCGRFQFQSGQLNFGRALSISVASRVLVCAGGWPGDSLFVQKITFCLVESFLLKKPPWEGRGGRTGDRIERNDLWNKQRKLGSVRQNVLSVLNLKGTLTEN